MGYYNDKMSYPVNPFFLLTGDELPVPPEELGWVLLLLLTHPSLESGKEEKHFVLFYFVTYTLQLYKHLIKSECLKIRR